jgi:hypothetical protein
METRWSETSQYNAAGNSGLPPYDAQVARADHLISDPRLPRAHAGTYTQDTVSRISTTEQISSQIPSEVQVITYPSLPIAGLPTLRPPPAVRPLLGRRAPAPWLSSPGRCSQHTIQFRIPYPIADWTILSRLRWKTCEPRHRATIDVNYADLGIRSPRECCVRTVRSGVTIQLDGVHRLRLRLIFVSRLISDSRSLTVEHKTGQARARCRRSTARSGAATPAVTRISEASVTRSKISRV